MNDSELVKLVTERKVALCPLDDPSPVAYFNVYEVGDIWVKIKGCEDCPLEDRRKCCGNCPMFSELGCYWHLESGNRSSKPYNCIVDPTPDKGASYCQLEFKCVAGSKAGKIRKVREPGNVFGDR